MAIDKSGGQETMTTIRVYREVDESLLVTKVLSTELIDLQEVAQDCELGPEGSIYFRGPNHSKVSFSKTPVPVSEVLELCGSKGDLYLQDNPFGQLRFLKLKYAKATKTFAGNLDWKDFTGWVLEVTPQLTGYEITAKITCKDLTLDARSEGEFSNAVSSFLKFNTTPIVELSVSVKQGQLRSFSTFTGDRGVKDGMAILLGAAYSVDTSSHQNPKAVGKLDGYPAVGLSEELLKTKAAKRFTGGRDMSIQDLITQTVGQVSAAFAACGESNAQTEATKRTFIDHILVLVAAIVSTLLELDDELELCMEFPFENGKIDYIYRYLRALVALIEAKGECKLPHFRGQALVEMASLARIKLQDSKKRDWEEAEDPATVGVLTNADEWEFIVCRPKATPPVTFRRLLSDMAAHDWQDLEELQRLFTPVIEQLVGILRVECKAVKERAAKKAKSTA